MVVVKHQVQETAGAIEETGALPPGWVKLKVRSSGIEYYRHEDGQVLWKRPTHDKNDTSLFSPIGALGKPEGQAPLVTPGTPSFLSPTGHTKPTPARTHWSPPPPTPAGGQTRPGSAQEDGPLSEKQIAAGWKRCISCAPYPCGPCVLWQAPMYGFRSWAIELKDALPHALFVILAQVRIALAGAGLLQKSCDGPDAVDASECSGMRSGDSFYASKEPRAPFAPGGINSHCFFPICRDFEYSRDAHPPATFPDNVYPYSHADACRSKAKSVSTF